MRERIREAERVLSQVRCHPPRPYYVNGKGSSEVDYCYECAEAELARLQDKHPDEEYFLSRAGDTANDGATTCDGCFVLLDYYLTDYGAEAEIEHFLQYGHLGIDGIFHPSVAFEVVEILAWSEGTKDEKILADVLRIGETAVQLIGYDQDLSRWADDGGSA